MLRLMVTARELFALSSLLLCFFLANAGHAAILSRSLFGFGAGAALQGTFSYDEATETPGVGVLLGFKHYDVTALSLTFDGAILGIPSTSWTLADLVGVPPGGDFRASVDPLGVWALGGIDVSVPVAGDAVFRSAELYDFLFQPRRSLGGWHLLYTLLDGQGNVVLLGGILGTAELSVPEPSTLALLSLALAGLGFARRCKLH